MMLAAVSGGALASAMKADKYAAAKVEADLSRGEIDTAVVLGERALAASPRDAALRAALGHAYLRAGRFASAETALADAVSLGDSGGRTALALALAEIANGKSREAVGVLDNARDAIQPADLGLAMALAGEGARGVAILSEAMRSGDGSAKLRQNLAYANALDGHWAEARVLAAIDLPVDAIDARITQWAETSAPEAYRRRVVSLLGVSDVADPGLPTVLALNAPPAPAMPVTASVEVPAQAPATPITPAAPPQVAVVARPAPVAEPVRPDADRELPALAAPASARPAPAAPTSFANAFPARAPAASRPTPVAVAHHVQPALAHKASPHNALAHARPAPTLKLARSAEPRPATSSPAAGTHLVQLGAFAAESNAQKAKAEFIRRHPGDLHNHQVAITQARVNGRTFWRVAVMGFAASGAQSLCGSIRHEGGTCLALSSEAPSSKARPSAPSHPARALAMAGGSPRK